MGPDVLPVLRDPLTQQRLHCVTRSDENGNPYSILVSMGTGDEFPIVDGIPQFLGESDLHGHNRKYRRLYDRIAPLYDLSVRGYAWLAGGGEEARRGEYLGELEVHQGDLVLEVSIGTGRNLRFLPREARYFGLDISLGMLGKCQRNLRSWRREADLFLGAAEHLPFADETFDVVFHVGGINFFSDRGRAVREMVRVAKPGTRLLIVDENEKIAKYYEKTPFVGRFFRGRRHAVSAPVDSVPSGVSDLRLRDICDGDLYCLTFRKPG
jgi:ubiquinone/menaquinone biosynthesis C-methylase UbiE